MTIHSPAFEDLVPAGRAPFADASDSPWAWTGLGWLEAADAGEHLAQADAADRSLLRLVACAAAATLLLALAASLGG